MFFENLKALCIPMTYNFDSAAVYLGFQTIPKSITQHHPKLIIFFQGGARFHWFWSILFYLSHKVFDSSGILVISLF
jgi:hypothetical protein